MTDQPLSLLIVEDDVDFRESSVRWMQRKGHHVASAASGAEAISLLDRRQFDVGIFDMNMPGMTGIELLQRIQQEQVDIEVIILTGQGTIETAVQAMKLGACDYLTKPFPLGDLEHHCRLAAERGKLRKENQQLREIISRGRRKTKIVGDSPAMRKVTKLVERVAPTDKPVLITGESGTGKEVVARAVQESSTLANQPFVTINCAALPEQLVESELFGHQKGSFTGATSEKPGLFEVADGGTLFIDELGELPLSLQPKLLRVLEDGSMRRIGSHKERKVNVRIIAATNRDLGERVREGQFREDLFYRVNVLPIPLPPLRERQGDIDLLISHFLPADWQIDSEARDALNQYHWPGNVRELINVIQRATILADGKDITIDDLPGEIVLDLGVDRPAATNAPTLSSASIADRRIANPDEVGTVATADIGTAAPSSISLDDVQKAHIFEMLEKHNGNKAKTARALGIHRRKLYRLLERFQEVESQGSEANENENANENAHANANDDSMISAVNPGVASSPTAESTALPTEQSVGTNPQSDQKPPPAGNMLE